MNAAPLGVLGADRALQMSICLPAEDTRDKAAAPAAHESCVWMNCRGSFHLMLKYFI